MEQTIRPTAAIRHLVPFLLLITLGILPTAWAGAQGADWPPGLSEDMVKTPGVYRLESDRRLAVVGQGRISGQLRDERARRLALNLAEIDAKKRLAKHLFPEEIKKRGRASLSLTGVRLIDSRAGDRPDMMLVTILVDPALVELLPYDPTEEFSNLQAGLILGELLREAPALAGGGGQVFERGQGWLALGIGYAQVSEDGQRADEARIRARMDAAEALNKAVYGSRFSVASEHRELVAIGAGGDRMREWSKNSTREEVEGVLAGLQVLGEWTLDDSLGLAVVIGYPPLDLGLDYALAPELDLRDLEMEADWRDSLARRPWLLSGGAAALCRQPDGRLWLLTVESGPLQHNPAHDQIQLPIIIETKSRSQVVRFLAGFLAGSLTIEQEELALADGRAETRQALHRAARENASGLAAGLQKVGQWRSDDDRLLYQAFAVRLGD